jgi:hypothetical protein
MPRGKRGGSGREEQNWQLFGQTGKFIDHMLTLEHGHYMLHVYITHQT